MEYLQLGISVIIPVFFVLLIGQVLKIIGFVDETFISKGNNIIFYIALPCSLFFNIRDSKTHGIDVKYIAYIMLGTVFVFAITWFFARFFIEDKNKLSAFVHCSYRSNFLYIGLPILNYIYPNIDMDPVIIVFVFGISMFNLLAIILLSYYSGDEFNLKIFLLKIIKNPMIIVTILALIAKKTSFSFYQGVEDGMHILGSLATPFSLLMVGASLEISKHNKDFGLSFGSAFIKVVLAALVLVPIAYFLGFDKAQITVAYVFFATPCAVNCFIMGKNMGSDSILTSKIITVSYLMSIFTYAIGIALLKYFEIIAI